MFGVGVDLFGDVRGRSQDVSQCTTNVQVTNELAPVQCEVVFSHSQHRFPNGNHWMRALILRMRQEDSISSVT